MSGFQLDTSGRCGTCGAGALGNCGYYGCATPREGCPNGGGVSTPFAAGYIKAFRSDLPVKHRDAPFAPATLARIYEDCERMADLIGSALTADDGRSIWGHRQEGFPGPGHLDGELGSAFPPLTVTLGDDGLIYFREAGQ